MLHTQSSTADYFLYIRRRMYTQLLQYHLLPHVLDTTNMTAGQSLTTKLEGREITVASMSAQAGAIFPLLGSSHLFCVASLRQSTELLYVRQFGVHRSAADSSWPAYSAGVLENAIFACGIVEPLACVQVHLKGAASGSTAIVQQPNVVVCRSVMHVVDTVLLPISVAQLAAGRSAVALPPSTPAPSALHHSRFLIKFE